MQLYNLDLNVSYEHQFKQDFLSLLHTFHTCLVYTVCTPHPRFLTHTVTHQRMPADIWHSSEGCNTSTNNVAKIWQPNAAWYPTHV